MSSINTGVLTQNKRKITEESKPFVSFIVSRKMMFIDGVGRLCSCGCNETVVGNLQKRFVNRKHKDAYRYRIKGKKKSRNNILASVAINVNYDGSRNISIYFKKGIKKDIRFTRNNCVELWNTLNQISEFRNKLI